MDRIGKFAVALSVATLLAWMYFNSKDMEKAAAARQAAIAVEQAQKAAEQPASPEGAAPAAAATPAVPAAPAAPSAPEKLEKLVSPLVELSLSNLGGGIARSVLLKHEAEHGKTMVINEFGSIPIGAVSELAGEGTNIPFNVVPDPSGTAVTFQHTDTRQLELTKRFTLAQPGEDEYSTHLDVTFTNRGTQPVTLAGYYVHSGAAAPVHESDLPMYTGLMASGGKFIDANSGFKVGGVLGMGSTPQLTYTESRAGLAWLGLTNQYFTTLLSPKATATDPAAQSKQRGSSVWARRFDIAEDVWKESGRTTHGNSVPRHAILGALGMPGFALAPGESVTQSFLIYAGPSEFSRLKRLGNGEEQIMNFGMFGIVSKTLLNGLNWLHAHLGSYAAAIIVLTLIIKSLLWPLQNKATQSMKRMQLLAPKQAELREKYKDDPTRMNTETMKLYKDYQVNPLSGCLPMLIQIPIFFGFYNMLGKAVELRNSHFLWINDLSQPDTVFHLGGVPVNILPLVMAGTMFWQMAISPKSGDPMQQRMFMFMPLIFVFFCYNYASALALYWTVQNLFSVVQLYATRNQAPPQLVKVAAPKRK